MGIAAKTCLALALCQAAFSQNTSLPLPRVDLRYEVHEALSFNASSPSLITRIMSIHTVC